MVTGLAVRPEAKSFYAGGVVRSYYVLIPRSLLKY